METVDVKITLRVDRNLKDNAETLFAKLGMNMTTAVNVFLAQAVRDQSIPFIITANQAKPAATYTVEDITRAFADTIRMEKADSLERGLPVAEYDREKKKAYLRYPDGRREYDDN